MLNRDRVQIIAKIVVEYGARLSETISFIYLAIISNMCISHSFPK